MTSPHIRLTSGRLDALDLTSGLTGHSTGAVASFSGQVRGEGGLSALELQHHPVLTRAALTRIAETAIHRFDLTGLVLAHRYGKMSPGEVIVFIAASAPHRRAALDAVSFAIDIAKTQAPFWKREWYGDTYRWIEPTPADHEAAAAWLSHSGVEPDQQPSRRFTDRTR